MTDLPPAPKLPIEVEEIFNLLPHRYPFLLVDRVVELVPGEKLIAVKNVSINEPFFQGHFPGHPVMPGVLIIEALAQSAGILTRFSLPPEIALAMFYLVKVDKARFNAVVIPGDQLRLEITLKRFMRNMGMFSTAAYCDDKLIASCEIMCAARTDNGTDT